MWLFRRQRWQYAYSRRTWLYFRRGDPELCIRYQGEFVKMTLGCQEFWGDILKTRGDMQAAEEEYLKVLFILQEKYFLQKSWMERLRENLGNTA